MANRLVREHHIAELAVLRASILAKQVQSVVDEISKDDNSPVTIADFAAQALLVKAILHHFPEDEFLGEEDADALRESETLRNAVFGLVTSSSDVMYHTTDGQKAIALPKPDSVDEMMHLIDLGGRGSGRRNGRWWVMDPIDGTAAFLKGQQFAVSLSLIENGKEVLGVLGCPNLSGEMDRISDDSRIDTEGLGIMLTAVSGHGATMRTMMSTGLGDALSLEPLGPSRGCHKLCIVDSAACQVCRHDVVAKLASKFGSVFPHTEIWSSHVRYAALILGGDNVHVLVPRKSSRSKMYIWDHAGTHLIFKEVGGTVTDLDGKEIDFKAGRDLGRNRGLVAARSDVHASVLATINRILDEEEEEEDEANSIA